MRIKDGFILREIQGQHIVVPFGIRAKENTTMITLNNTAALIWEMLQCEISFDKVVEIVSSRFPSVQRERVYEDIALFIDNLRSEGIIFE